MARRRYLTDRSSFQAAPALSEHWSSTDRGGARVTIGQEDRLSPQTTGAVLARLGFSEAPAADFDGLASVYAAWCDHVPFDNVVKRIHLASESADPIPNGPPEAFFASYLQHGAGGTCWPSSGALYALLVTLGFDARRGSGAMRDDLSGPIHSHGTVIVRIDARDYWVDTSMLTRRVLSVQRGEAATLDAPIHAARVEPVDDLWRVWWTHNFLDEMLGCLLLDDNVTGEHYLARYEWSRGSSPFNRALYATRSFEDRRVTLAYGQRFERRAGGVTSRPLADEDDRRQTLVEEFGYSEAIVAALPIDDR
jgi:arylamine N-acetyltransferase